GGYLAGRVVLGGSGLSNILVSAGGETRTTDANGHYWLPLDEGTYIVTANPDNTNPAYTVGESTDVIVNLGEVSDVPEITVSQGGILHGYIRSGVDPLPGIPVIATNTAGSEVGSAISDSLGRFYFPDLSSGTYTLSPQLETGESASP